MPQKKVLRVCPDCGEAKEVFAIGGKPTGIRCRKCHAKRVAEESKNHPEWRPGNPNFGKHVGYHYERGYKLIKLLPSDPFYPMANNKGFVREHRLVVAQALGRCLKFGEVVHHKHGFAKDDNRYPETLQLNTIDGHNTISAMQNRIDALERRIRELLQKNKE
jgi:hypothetical protein